MYCSRVLLFFYFALIYAVFPQLPNTVMTLETTPVTVPTEQTSKPC
jgi:hypothetical protein